MSHGAPPKRGTWHLLDNKPWAVYLRKLISSIMFDKLATTGADMCIEIAYDPGLRKTLKTLPISVDKRVLMGEAGGYPR